MELQFNKRLYMLLLSAAYMFVTLTHISLIRPIRSHRVDNSLKADLHFKSKFTSNSLGSLKVSLKRVDKNLPKTDREIRRWAIEHQLFFLNLFIEPNNAVSLPSKIAFSLGDPPQRSILCCYRL